MRQMLIHVVTRDGRKTLYELDHFGTVGQLKARIGRHMTVPMGFSRLTYKGRLLENHSVLEEVGVKRMSTLHLCWQPLVFTPKQLREREDELDKLEEMQRAGEILPEVDQDQEVAALDAGSATGSKLQLSLASRSCGKLPDIDTEDLEEVTSISSSELDFLALYRRPKSGKKADELLETEEEALDPEPIALPLKEVVYKSDDFEKIEEQPPTPKAIALPTKGPSALARELPGTSDPQPPKSTTANNNRKKNAKKNAKKNRKNK